MSLRELPPGQAIDTRRWRRLRYAPLIVLVLAALVAMTLGLVSVPQAETSGSVATDPTSDRLPRECLAPVDIPAESPWAGSRAESSERQWASHATEFTKPYIEGKDGWVFWGDVQANNFSQALGRRTLSAAELTAWHDYIFRLDATLTAAGTQLYVVFAPAKWAIYPDELPEWTDDLQGSGSLDQLLAVSSDLPVIDIRAQLRAASQQEQTYSKVNSHWSDYGAYVGWNAIASCIKADQPDIPLSPLPLAGVHTSADYNEFSSYGFADQSDYTIPDFAEALRPVRLTVNGRPEVTVDGAARTDLTQLPATTDTEGAQSSDSVLFVRDSFGTSLSVYLQQAFAHTVQVRHNIDAGPGAQPDIATLAAAYRPDIVILEIAQRHLNWLPTS